MGKIVFWLVLIFGVLLVLRILNVAKSKARTRRAGKAAQPPAAMVRCVECGVFLPKAEAHPVPAGFHCGQANCAQQRAGKR